MTEWLDAPKSNADSDAIVNLNAPLLSDESTQQATSAQPDADQVLPVFWNEDNDSKSTGRSYGLLAVSLYAVAITVILLLLFLTGRISF